MATVQVDAPRPLRPALVVGGPAVAVLAVVVLLCGLEASVPLGAGGWAAGLLWGLGVDAVLVAALSGAGAARLGPANAVTLTRAVLVAGVTALVVAGLAAPTPVPLLAGLSAVALALDAVDGRVARRTGSVTPLGARFDMEVDAFLILVLSVHVATLLGPWVLLIGAARYLLGAAGWVWPWLQGPVPPRYWRKVVAAVQGVVLAVVSAQVLPGPVAVLALVVAAALLAESFGRDVVTLRLRHRRG